MFFFLQKRWSKRFNMGINEFLSLRLWLHTFAGSVSLSNYKSLPVYFCSQFSYSFLNNSLIFRINSYKTHNNYCILRFFSLIFVHITQVMYYVYVYRVLDRCAHPLYQDFPPQVSVSLKQWQDISQLLNSFVCVLTGYTFISSR